MPFTPGCIGDLRDNKFESLTRCAFAEITGYRVILEPEISPIGEQEYPSLEVLVCLFENTLFDGLGHGEVFVANEVAADKARWRQTS